MLVRAVLVSLFILSNAKDELLNWSDKTVRNQSSLKDGKNKPASFKGHPHIIFFLADDLGWNDVSYHGKGRSLIRTPTLDRLANDGVKLENYYVQPVCSPTRSQLMTGRYQIRMGIQHTNFSPGETICLPLNETLLPEILRKEGYATHAVGKWHLGMAKRACLPTRRGFDSFFGILLGSSDHFTHVKAAMTKTKTLLEGNTFYKNENATSKYSGIFSAELYTKRAIQIIKNHKKKKPLFLYVPFQMVHRPNKIPKKYMKRYKIIKNKDRRAYAGRVTALDVAVKDIVKALRLRGLYKNSVIIFSTDNGGQFKQMACNWPLRGGKGRLWEGGVRAVGFIHSPLLPKRVRGTSYNGLMHITDWLPTLVQGVAGGNLKELPNPLDGYNLWKSIKNSKESPRLVLLHNINPAKGIKDWTKDDEKLWGKLEKLPFNATIRAAIRVGDWKLITGKPGSGQRHLPKENRARKRSFRVGVGLSHDQSTIRLFNIRKDPIEKVNLASKYPTRVMKMLRKLRHFQKESVDPIDYTLDEKSDPALFGGAWTPWMDNE